MKTQSIFRVSFLSFSLLLFIALTSCGSSNDSEIAAEENLVNKSTEVNSEDEQNEEIIQEQNEEETIHDSSIQEAVPPTKEESATSSIANPTSTNSENTNSEQETPPVTPQPDPVVEESPLVVTPTNDNDWSVPTAAKSKKNPIASNAESLSTGKTFYKKHCSSCHGSSGKGDGPKSDQLDTESTDFTSAAFQKQTDGAILYKTKQGREDMPNFKKKIPNEEDLWHIINYIRTLK